MAQAHANPTDARPSLRVPPVEESIRPEIRAAKDLPDGVPPETPFKSGEQARQTTSIWMFIGIAMVVAGLLLAVFSM